MTLQKSTILGIFAGTILGLLISVILALLLISAIGESINVENANITIGINQTQLEGSIREHNEIQPSKLQHILFAGATFEYGKYVIKADVITPGKVELSVLLNGDIISTGACHEYSICTIQDVSFQIDDIHVGDEMSYLVYWSNQN